MKKYPEACTGAYIKNSEGKVLLVKSYKWGGQIWSVSGGHVELGESIEDSIKREVKEEVGIEIDNVKIFAVYDAIFPKSFFQKKHFIFLECECQIKKGSKIKLDKKEIQEARWFTLDEALKQKLEKYTRASLNALKGKTTNFYHKL